MDYIPGINACESTTVKSTFTFSEHRSVKKMWLASEEFRVTCSGAPKRVLSVTRTLCPLDEMLACAVKPKYIKQQK